MFLFVDDQRTGLEKFEVARTITEAIRLLSENNVECLSLDHDIQLVPTFTGGSVRQMSAESYEPVARYVALMKRANQPKIIFIHTANPNGARNMTRILSGSASKIVRVSPIGYEEDILGFLRKHEFRSKEE